MWDFKTDNGAISVGEKLQDAILMTVPAAYNDLTESVELRDYAGVVYYQRTFCVPKSLRTERIVLRFAAITHKATVYLNGQEITRHKGGFLPFEVEITNFIQWGDNLLTIAVDNTIDKFTLPVGDEDGNGMLSVFGPESTKRAKSTKKRTIQILTSLTMQASYDRSSSIQLLKNISKTLRLYQK
nr:sugar-binding domain-containing protein [Collinsella urealyticum]